MEIRTRHHKTARSALKKTVLLPIIAPARGVDGSIWVHDVAKAFADIGLPFEDCTNNPLFRPVGADGTLCKRGVTSSETNKFLELLFPDVTLTSHSCKCTALSWAAKYGLEPHDRSVLGRHADATKDTSAIYSRDLSVKSVTALQKVIDAIHEGSFKPDETRKGYFQNDVIEIPPEVSVGHTSAKVENIEIKDDDSECVNLVSEDSEGQDANEDLISSESSSDTSSSGDDDTEALPSRPKIIKVQTSLKEDSGITFKHCTSKTVHYMLQVFHTKFVSLVWFSRVEEKSAQSMLK